MKQKTYNIKFFKEFAANLGGECLSEEYINVRAKLEFRCKSGHEWAAQPRKVLESSWCPECAFDGLRKYSADHEFFSADTENTFYWAGFFAADGWISKATGAYIVGLGLAAKDFEHLFKFRQTVKSNKPFRYTEHPSPSPNTDTICKKYELRVTSKNMFNELKRFNIIPTKTYIYTMPEWIKTHPLVHHYMRGYIDGDGCFTLAQNKGQTHPHVLFCMRGTVELLQAFHDVLVDNNVVKDSAYNRRKKLRPKDGKKYPAFDKLTYSGNTVISKMHDFLYKDATVYLDRKKQVAAKAKEYAVYGDGERKKKVKENSLQLTKDRFLSLMAEHKTQVKVAKHLGCTAANITWWVNELGVTREEIKAVGGKVPVDVGEVMAAHKQLGTCKAVGERLGISTSRVSQIVKANQTG